MRMGGRKIIWKRQEMSENINFYAMDSIKLYKLCHCDESNESVLMTVQMKMHAPITVFIFERCKNKR